MTQKILLQNFLSDILISKGPLISGKIVSACSGKGYLLTCICPNWKSIYLQCSKNMTRAKWPVSMWKLIVHGKA